MPTTAATAAAITTIDPLLGRRTQRSSAPPSPQHRRSSAPPSPQLLRSSSASDWSTERRTSYFASYIPRTLYTAHQPPRLPRSSNLPVDRRCSGKEVKEPAAPAERKAKAVVCVGAVEDLGYRRELISVERDTVEGNGRDRDRMDDLRTLKELTDGRSNVGVAQDDVENGYGMGRSTLAGDQMDGQAVEEELLASDRLMDQEGWVDVKDERNVGLDGCDLESGELAGDQVDELSNGDELISGTSSDDVSGGEGGSRLMQGDSILLVMQRTCDRTCGLEKGEPLGYRTCELSVSEEFIEEKKNDVEKNGCENGRDENDGFVSDEMDERRDELCSVKEPVNEMSSGGVENGGEYCDGFVREELVCDEIENLCNRKDLVSGNCTGNEENGCAERAEAGSGELVCDQIDDFCIIEDLDSGIAGDDNEGCSHESDVLVHGTDGCDLETGELVGDNVDDLFNGEELIRGTSNDGVSGGEVDSRFMQGDSILDKSKGDAESGSGLEKGEPLGDRTRALSVGEEFIEGKKNGIEENGFENGRGMENGGFVSDEMDGMNHELCSEKEPDSEMSSSGVENGSEDCVGLVRGEFLCNGIEDLCDRKDLVSGNSASNDENGCAEHAEIGSGELVRDEIDGFCTIENLVSGNTSDGIDNAGCCHESDVLVNAELHNLPDDPHSDGSSMKSSSLLAKLESDLNSARLNLLQEMERRREAEESLAHMQKQWKTIAAYFTLAGLPYPPAHMGGNQQLEDNPVHVYQEVVAAKAASRDFRRILSQTENKSSMELLIESKNSEIAHLHDKLKHYEAINHELSQRNQEAAEISRKRRQKRKARRKLIWTCIGFSVTIGASLAAYSFLLHDASRVPLPLPSDSSARG